MAVFSAGSWVTVLESVPYGEGLAEAEQRARAFAAGEVFLIDTADHPEMTPGYWAVVIGPYETEGEARDGCALAGRSPGGTCYERRTG
jgi:hypothetical protein